MAAYWRFAVCAFSRSLAYRANVYLRVVGSLVTILIQVAIWRSLLGHGAVAGVGLAEMVTYAILSTCVGMAMLSGQTLRTVDQRLRTGDIAVDLIKPVSYPLYLAADGLGSIAFQGLFTVLPTLGIAALFFGLQPPASGAHFLAFVVALLLATGISFAIGYLTALLAFWLLTAFVFEWSIGALVQVFGGAFLPLWFFPPWLAEIAAWLPFRYLYFVPVAVYLGRIPVAELAGTLALGIVWLAALLALAGWLWDRSTRRLVFQGG